MSTDLYLNIQASLFFLCREIISQVEGLSIGNLELVNWDAHAILKELPPVDLLGPSSAQIELVERQLVHVTCRLALSTYQDTNLARLDQMMNVMLDFVLPERVIKLMHHTTPGLQVGKLKVFEGTMIEPVMKADIRALRAIWFRAGSDQALP